MRGIILYLVFGCMLTFSGVASGQSWPDSLEQVERLYRIGQFDEAELTALRLLNRQAIKATADKAELHRILAFISIARDDRDNGLEQFLAALRLNPRMQLDRTLTSPKIYSVFERAKQSFDQMSRKEQTVNSNANASYYIRIKAGHRSLLLPGLGQLYKGHTTRGVAFLTASSAAVVGLAITHSTVLSRSDRYHESSDPEEASQLYQEYRDAWQLRNAFGVAIVALWTASTLDAFFSPLPQEKGASLTFRLGSPYDEAVGAGVRIRF